MGSLLVHITHGPEAPTRATLGCLVAKAAAEDGHDVSLFFGGDAAVLVKDDFVANVTGVGTGALADHIPALVKAGVPIYVSGMSAKARDVTEVDLESTGATFILPSRLVELTFAADRVLCY